MPNPALPSTRPATPADEAATVALWRACDLVASYNDPNEDFRRALSGLASTVLVMEEQGAIIGAVMPGDDGHRGWLYYVAAAPAARGRGIGRAMVRAGEAWLAARGVVKVQLLVRETNTQVVGFYDSLEYETTPRTVMARWLVKPEG